MYTKFGVDWSKGFEDIVRKPIRTDRRTDRQTDGAGDDNTLWAEGPRVKTRILQADRSNE